MTADKIFRIMRSELLTVLNVAYSVPIFMTIPSYSLRLNGHKTLPLLAD